MPPAARGRPRSEPTRLKVLAAARDLLLEDGYDHVTMAGIAARAGVGKQTLYRWWPAKASLVADCVIEDVLPFTTLVVAPSDDAIAALHSWLLGSFRRLSDPESVELIRGMTAAASSDPIARERLLERFGQPIRDSIQQVLQRGISAGQVRADVSAESVADLLVGLMMYSLFDPRLLTESRADVILDILAIGVLRSTGD